MNEGVVTHHALGGIVAEGDAVYRGEIRIAAGFADPRRAELAGRCGRLGDALRRRGVGRHHVGAIGGACARDRSAKGAPPAKRGEEPSRAVGVVSGAGDGLDADLVSLEFLRAGKAGDGELRTRLDFVLSLALGEQLRIDARKQRGRLLELGPLGCMARRDVADLMRHDGGDFRRIVGEREKAAGDVNIPRGQGEGVDDRRIQHRDAVGLPRGVRRRREFRENPVEIGLGRRRRIDAAERLD